MRSRSMARVVRSVLLGAVFLESWLAASPAGAQTCSDCDPDGTKEALCLDKQGIWDPDQCLCFREGECDPEDPCCEDPECCGDEECCGDPCCGDPCCLDPDCCLDPCCEDPDCCDDPCCGDPCCGDPCCEDPCCGDPCCNDPCCGDPCCGDTDPCCGSSDPCCGNPDPCCSDGDPCCGDPDPCCGDPDPCCGSTDACCGDADPCCGSSDPCCGNPDPCCGDDCCGDPCCGDACCADAACWDGSCQAGGPPAGQAGAGGRPPAHNNHNTTRPAETHRGVVYPTLAELVKRSRFVVVGVPARQPVPQTKGGKVIAHQFVVKVQEVLKGELRSGAAIRVNVRGSGQPFVPSPGEADLLVNRSQVLFLRSQPAGRNTTYELVGGREGLFPLNTVEGVVHLGDRWPDDPLAREYGQRPHKWLLSDVRLLAHKATSR